MTERLSDERLHHILQEYTDDCGWVVNADEVGDMAEEIFELRAEVKAYAGSLDDTIALLQDQNAYLRERCMWLQERRAVLRKLLAAKWSKRKEVRAMRAKLAAGQEESTVPGAPSDVRMWRETAYNGVPILEYSKNGGASWETAVGPDQMPKLVAGPVMPEEVLKGILWRVVEDAARRSSCLKPLYDSVDLGLCLLRSGTVFKEQSR